MNRLRLSILLIIAVTLTGCDEKALQLAKDVKSVLDSYQAELGRKIDAEQKAYTQQAQTEAQAVSEQVATNLAQERIERSLSVALDILADKQEPARWREPIREYAAIDYAIQRDSLLADMDNQAQYLQKIQALTVDKQKIAVLSKAFAVLADKPGLVDQLKGLGAYAMETSDDFEKSVCAGLATQITDKTAIIASTTISADDKAKAQTALTALEDTQKTKACPTTAGDLKKG